MKIKSKIAYFIKSNYYSLRDLFFPEALKLDFFSKKNNFGDILNKYLVEQLSGKTVHQIRSWHYNKPHFFVIGSILQDVNKYSIVWGSGFISIDSKCKESPKIVRAVRGPLSRKMLLNQGIDCPEVYGDPALLMPKIYNPINIDKKYELGIIAHYVDKDSLWIKNNNSKNIKFIDIQTSNFTSFIDQIKECKKIISSSLHGIIIADAYDVPSLWVEFSKKVYGDGFKFKDYFASVGRTDTRPFTIKNDTSIDEILASFRTYSINVDLEKLINAAPFKIKDKFTNELI